MIQSYLITGSVSALIAFGGGWKVHGWKVDAAHKKALEAQQEAHIEALDKLEIDLQNADIERLRLSTELNAARANVRTITREIVREVPKYVEDSTPDCDRSLSPELVSLYNRSIGRAYPRSEGEENTSSGSLDGMRLSGGVAEWP